MTNDPDTRALLVRHVLTARDDHDTVNPDEVAKHVYHALNCDERDSVLRLILPNAVRHVLNYPPSETVQPTIAGPVSSDQTLVGPSRMARASYFMRRAYAPEFGECYLGDLTPEMVQQVSAYRFQQSHALAAKAIAFENLHKAMVEHDAAHVSDLSVALVGSILDGGVR